MNIHPLFVHFPIGILVLYALIELGSVLFCRQSLFVKQLKGVLVLVGAASALVAASFGDSAEELLRANPTLLGHVVDLKLVETHAMFAGLTILTFGLLAAAYLVWFVEHSTFGSKPFLQSGWVAKLWHLLQAIGRFIRRPWLAALLALAGLVAITITGGLGAAIVYGPAVDPFVQIIYNLFF